nr:hypothetical protein [Tanacetum cinerariifolium]
MESSTSNPEEKELEQIQLEERHLYSKCMAWFKELNSHLETLHNNIEKMYHNFNHYNGSLKERIFIPVIQRHVLMYLEHHSRNFLTQKRRPGNENISYDNESSSLGDNARYAEKTLVDTIASDIKYAGIVPSHDSDTTSE